jgi:uncharacterized protein (DUF2164 family)
MLGSASIRIFWLLIALSPLMLPLGAGLKFLIIAILLNGAFSAVSNISWNSWMRDLMPQDRLGSFYSRRMSLSIGVSIPLGLAAGLYIDYWKRIFPNYEIYGYSALFFLGFLAGILGVYFISTMLEPQMAPVKEKVHFFRMVLQPFRDANFKSLILFLGSWNFA